MMIVKKWCTAVIIVPAVFVCTFNIQLLLCLKINIYRNINRRERE